MTNKDLKFLSNLFLGVVGLTVAPFENSGHENNGHEWTKWLQSFEFCMKANAINDAERKLAMLLHMVGPKVQNIYSKLPEKKKGETETARGPLATGYVLQKSSYEEAVEKLNNYFLPKQNDAYERHVMRLMKQEEDETIDEFVMRLRPQAERCNFGDSIDEHIKDQIIEKCRSAAMRRDMLKHGGRDLDTVLGVAKTFELVAKQEKAFAKIEPTPSTSAITLDVNKIGTTATTTDVNKINSGNGRSLFKRKRSDEKSNGCSRCGFATHRSADGKCPAMGKTCNRCQGKNHFANQCKSKTVATSTNNMKRTNTDGEDVKRPKQEKDGANANVVKFVDEYVFCIQSDDQDNIVRCKIGQVEATAIIDSGSKYNLLDYKTWSTLKEKGVVVSNQRKDTDKVFRSYGGNLLTVVGVFDAQIQVGKHETTTEFYVIKEAGKFLIGRVTGKVLKLLKIGHDINQVEEKKEFSKIKDVEIDIPLRDDVVPVVQPFRRMAVPLEQAVDAKINDLLETDIIEKVVKPSKWVSPVVAVPKDDGKEVRICLDMRRANEAVQRENYPLPTMDSFLPYINHSKWFSKVDIKQAFHQVPN